MSYRVIALDLDGTLLTPNKTILPESLEALARAQAGNEKVIAREAAARAQQLMKPAPTASARRAPGAAARRATTPCCPRPWPRAGP